MITRIIGIAIISAENRGCPKRVFVFAGKACGVCMFKPNADRQVLDCSNQSTGLFKPNVCMFKVNADRQVLERRAVNACSNQMRTDK